MILSIESTYNGSGSPSHEIDLDDLVANDSCLSHDTLHSLIVIEVATWATKLGCSFDDVYPMHIEDDNGHQLDAGPTDNTAWIKEVARLVWFVEQGSWSVDPDRVFAVINAVNWKYVDFDDLQSFVDDDYCQEFEGDYEDFGRERASELCEDVPEHLERYFDYERYGRDVIEGYNAYEWNDRTFLYSN